MTVTVGQLQNGGYVGQDDRNILGALLTRTAPATVLEGILDSDGTDFAVTAQGTPNMTVNVAKGDLVIPDASGGAYLLHNSATKIVTIDTAPVSGTRYDLIIARVYDNAAGDAASTTTMAMAGATAGNATVQTVTGDIEVVKGTAGGSPSPPALPTTRCRVLKVVLVGTGVTSITNGNLSNTQGSATRLGSTGAATRPPSSVVFTSNGTWTKPAGLKAIRVRGVGSGAGSGGVGAGAGQGASGGGGGGGYFERIILASALGATETVTIGNAGAAGAAGTNPGGTGGTVSFGSWCTGNGGVGGIGMTATGGAAQVGGGVGGTATGGDINIQGSDGGTGIVIGGQGYFLNFGGASQMGGAAGTGAAGHLYGAGAAGILVSSSNTAGLAGGKGVVIVEQFF